MDEEKARINMNRKTATNMYLVPGRKVFIEYKTVSTIDCIVMTETEDCLFVCYTYSNPNNNCQIIKKEQLKTISILVDDYQDRGKPSWNNMLLKEGDRLRLRVVTERQLFGTIISEEPTHVNVSIKDKKKGKEFEKSIKKSEISGHKQYYEEDSDDYDYGDSDDSN